MAKVSPGEFIRQVRAEGAKVVWPTAKETRVTAIMVLMPQFYRDVWHEPKTWYLLGASIFWLILGNAAMFKMSNFRF